MNICDSIVRYGRDAVLRYRDVTGVSSDNEIPEIFIGSFISGGIYDSMNIHAHVERFYLTIAQEFQITVDSSTVNLFGGYRADIAVYQDGAPKAIVELKVFDDYKSPSGIVADRDKMSKLSDLCPIETYLGVLVTDTTRATYIDRIRTLEEELGRSFDAKSPVQKAHGGWNWCFVSMRTN